MNPKNTEAPAGTDPVAALDALGEIIEKMPSRAEYDELKKEVENVTKAVASRTSVPWSQQGDNKNRTFQYRKLIKKLALRAKGQDSENDWVAMGGEFERDILRQSARDFSIEQSAGSDQRSTMVTTNNTLGGYLVPDDIGGYSDLLRARNPIFSKFGTEIIPAKGSPYRYNRMASGATMTAVAESGAITETGVTFEQDAYYPKKYAGYIPISMESIMMDDPSIESAIRAELAGRASVNVATQFLIGTGVAGNPTGIFVDSRINTYSTNVNPLTTPGLMGMIEEIKTQNALLDGARLGWIMHPFVESAIMALSQTGTGSPLLFPANSGNYANEGLGIFGMPYATTTVLGGAENTADLGLVDWSQVALVRWGALQIDTNPSVQFLNDNLIVRVIDRFNVLIRQPKAIVFATAVGKA